MPYASLNVFTCADCDAGSERGSFSQATSDAEWHNTNTGHDVSATTTEGERWVLTDEGWRQGA